jgi:hypothetical protein
VFGILPKTITQLFATVRKPKKIKQAAQPATEKQTHPRPAAAERKTLSETGTFKVKKDSDDL